MSDLKSRFARGFPNPYPAKLTPRNVQFATAATSRAAHCGMVLQSGDEVVWKRAIGPYSSSSASSSAWTLSPGVQR
jgi:hypothetical protein